VKESWNCGRRGFKITSFPTVKLAFETRECLIS
jgi:hypothetical protein